MSELVRDMISSPAAGDVFDVEAPGMPRGCGTRGTEPPAADRLVRELIDAVDQRLSRQQPLHATYRLQFQAPHFGFSAAKEIVAYLHDLGVSHVYASPCLQSRRGSPHGYDIVDHSRLNEELGSEADFAAYADELRRQGLAQIPDVVPNHMSVNANENRWWADVLMHGPASRYAPYFDIDWQPVKRDLENKVLLPVLDDLSGNVLEAGRLSVEFCSGSFCVRGDGMKLPLDPRTWTRILLPRIDELTVAMGAEHPHLLELHSIMSALEHLPLRADTAPERVTERARETVVISSRLQRLTDQSPPIAAHIADNLRELNGSPGDPHSFDELDRLLSEQAYQLVHWKAGSDEMNYRRFFDITDLAAISMENREVFEETHEFLFRLAVHDRLQGLRIDHIDGLFDPAQYLWRLQWGYVHAVGRMEHARLVDMDARAPQWKDVERGFLRGVRSRLGFGAPVPDENSISREQRSRLPLFVVVEKILGADEPLPKEWPVQGTTGYDFLNQLNGLFLDRRGLRDLERYYARFTGQRVELRDTIYRSKRLIVEGAMQSELQLLAHRLNRLSNRHRRSRDYTLQALRSALREIIACFPVYRTYIRGRHVSERDRRVIQLAVAQARRRNPAMDAAVFDFIRDVLLLEQPPELDDEGELERDLFIGRLQQVTSPVMAKGVEDTAFYRHVPLVSINEVGGEPERPATTVPEFHRQNEWRRSEWPHSLLATTTHDTKRSEDVRARINVLSEVPGLWRSAVQRWSRWNRRHRREVDGQPAPSRNDEWLFYQTLVGVWPLSPPTEPERAALIARLQDYMEKAAHEAKLRTSWINPSAQYDAAVRDFVERVLTARDGRFAADLQDFHESIVDCGLFTALAQVLLKLTSPGTPDVYQGQEIWDFSLVDPDNRRPVDFMHRKLLLAEVKRLTGSVDGRRSLASFLASNPRDDRLKLLVTWTALQFRRAWPQFEEAEYLPLEARGAGAEHVCAFARVSRSGRRLRVALIVAPRLIYTLARSTPTRIPCGAEVWQDTAVLLAGVPDVPLRELMTGQLAPSTNGALALGTLLAEFPVALAASGVELPAD